MTTNQSLKTTLQDTATCFLKFFDTLDTSFLRRIQADSYTHHFAPASLNIPILSLDQFANHTDQLREVLKAFPVVPKETWVNLELRQVTFWATAVPEFHEYIIGSDEKEKWYYQGEYIFILSMDDSGQKVERVIEFLDSKLTEQFRELMNVVRKRLAESSSRAGAGT